MQNPRAVVSLLLLASSLAGLFPGPSSAGEALEAIQRRGRLIWGADQEGGGPFVYPDPADPSRLIGFEVDLAALLAEQLGVQPEFRQGQWDKLPELLDRGDLDIVLNGYEWTPSRADRFGTTIPYYIYELQLLARRDDTSLRSWDDLPRLINGRRRRVAVLGTSAAQDYIVRNFPQVEIVNFDGVSDAMRAVELNVDNIDANLQDLPIWTFYQSGFPGLQAIGDPVGRGYYVALTRRNEPELLRALNGAIQTALADGRLRKISQKYRMWNRTQSARGLETSDQGSFIGDGPEDMAAADPDDPPGERTETYIPVRGWEVLRQRGGLLVKSAGMTVALSVCAMPLAILAGLLLALCRRYGPAPLAKLSTLYVEVVRGTPLVLQLYVIFFMLPEIGVSLNAFGAAVLGLAINYSAYEAEIYRAGLQAIPTGQMEAALALGMSRGLAVRRVIVPQATRLVIPPVTNDFIALFKDTAVCSVITVVELSKQYYMQANSTGAVLELGILTALLYLAMSYPLSLIAGRLEQRLHPEKTA